MNTSRPNARRHTGPGRRRAALAACFAAVLTLGFLTAPAAMAADGPYNIDGTVPDGGTTELPDAFGNVKELGPLNASTTKIGVIHSDAVPTLDLTNPNAQVDLRRAWLDTERDTSTQHDWLYFAWERDKNTGSGFVAYEFMQNPVPAACAYGTATEAQLIAGCNPWANRRAGDFMILWDQQGNSLDLYLRTWSGTAPNLTLGAPTLLNSTVSQAAYSADGFKGEAAVDLTATIFGGSTACRSFANTIPSTVTGNSDTADYKDTILQTAPPISNCTSTTVTTPKQGDGSGIPAGGLDLGPSGVSVKDSAVVSLTGGTATPAGSVSFWLCKVDSPALCDTGGTQVGGAVSLTGASYPATAVSDATTVTEPGRYCWRAVYSGDSANGIPGSSDSSATECFTVNAVASSLTSAQMWVPNDSVTVSAPAGGALAGTVAFALYANGTCAGATTVYSTTVAVAGASSQTVSTSNTTAVSASGSFSWKVSYDSTNPAQKDIGDTCHETSALTITNGGTVTSP
jgi:hypothetical protein